MSSTVRASTMQRKVKPANQRVKRALKAREPKVFENNKSTIVVRGQKTSDVINQLLTDLYIMKKPDSLHFKRKNPIHPFEDAASLEFFSRQNDCGLFAFGSHSKKRPHNLVLGRFFNHEILDMFEVAVEDFKPLLSLPGAKPAFGEKPMFVFQGAEWDASVEFMRLKSVILDFFRGGEAKQVAIDGLNHVISCSIVSGKVYFRAFSVQYPGSSGASVNCELSPCGPNFNFTIRRSQLAPQDRWNEACRKPKQARAKKIKNVERSTLGDRVGRIHMHKQDMGKLQTRKMKGLKSKKQ